MLRIHSLESNSGIIARKIHSGGGGGGGGGSHAQEPWPPERTCPEKHAQPPPPPPPPAARGMTSRYHAQDTSHGKLGQAGSRLDALYFLR